MQAKFLTMVLLALIPHFANSLPVSKKSQAHPLKLDFNVVKYDKTSGSGTGRNTLKAANGVTLKLDNEYSKYIAQIQVGTPHQPFTIHIDTGSADLWLPSVNTTVSKETGTFNKAQSKSYRKFKDGFKTGYADGTYALGEWGIDNISLGASASNDSSSVTIKDLTFGIGTDQNVGQGIFGVGFQELEASNYFGDEKFQYDNFPMLLKNQGHIKKNAYSLYLNALEAESGLILFGAIDHAKYEGDLKYLDIVPIDALGNKAEKPSAFYVNLDGISSGNATFSNQTYPALLDSGATLVYAPEKIWQQIAPKYGVFAPQTGGYITACDTEGEPFVYNFGGKVIKVPFKDQLYKLKLLTGKPVEVDGKVQCLVGFMNSQSDAFILGDGFLRSAYVHYDLDDGKVGIAQAKYTDAEDIALVE